MWKKGETEEITQSPRWDSRPTFWLLAGGSDMCLHAYHCFQEYVRISAGPEGTGEGLRQRAGQGGAHLGRGLQAAVEGLQLLPAGGQFMLQVF